MDTIIDHPEIKALHNSVSNHSMYSKIKTLNELKIMMESHVFAVWDFMSLLKRLQREITCVQIPWKPSPYPKNLVRLINEIVLGEESDIDLEGKSIDHFSLYLKAMDEVKADTNLLRTFIEDQNLSKLSPAQRNFVSFNLNLALDGALHEVAASFFFGREKLIPDIFTQLLSDLEKNIKSTEQEQFPNLKYYLVRHIQLDGDEHSHLAHECLATLCANDKTKWEEARMAGLTSLRLRSELWDEVASRFN